MSDNFNLFNVQKALGYNFKDSALIKTAFVCNTDRKSNLSSNECLVFLGERLFDFILSDYVYTHYPYTDPKTLLQSLETYKIAVSSMDFIDENDLEGCIILSENSEAFRKSKTVHHEIFLASLAAIYRDGGISSLKSFILPILKGLDGEARYTPKLPSSIDLEDVKSVSSETHIKNTRVRTNSSSSQPSTIQKAATVENTPAPEPEKKPLKITEKLFGKKNKVKEEKATEEKPTVKAEASEKPSRSFIRDALAPVTLPEHLRSPKPKKPFNSEKKTETEKISASAKVQESHVAERIIETNENPKSLLQEIVQKNIRTASVLLKYNTARNSDSSFSTVLMLNDKVLSKGNGSSKKASEIHAAQIALTELNTPSSELGRWFFSQTVETVSQSTVEKDYVTKLNEHFQKETRTSEVPVEYVKVKVNEKRTKDPKGFVTAVKINGVELGVGRGFTPREAKQNAAKEACEMLNIQ